MKNLIQLVIFLSFIYSFSQEQFKDSLFIKYDKTLMKKFKEPYENYNYYIIKNTGINGTISFEEKQIYFNLKPKKIYCLEKLIKKADAIYKINKYKLGKINDSKLAKYLGKFKLFFVKKINI